MGNRFSAESIDVVREGRFAWQVHTCIPDGIDMVTSQPFWFRWTAERYARRQALREWGEQPGTDVVVRLTPDQH